MHSEGLPERGGKLALKPDIGILANRIFSFKVSYAHSPMFGICLSGDCEDSYTVEQSFRMSDKINMGNNETEWAPSS